MESYERPKLCRLCRCPVADGGVPLSDIDRPKLSEWWLQYLDTQFEDEDGEKEWICQFCVCDARFENEEGFCIKSYAQEWWPLDQNDFYGKYYQLQMVKPCFVTIEGTQNESSLTNHKTQWSHMQLIHEDLAIKSSYKHCPTFFKSQEEKIVHLKEIHKKASTIKCVYCKRVFTTAILDNHVSKVHAAVAIKCNVNLDCQTYFKNKQLRDRHVLEVHKKAKLEEERDCLYCGKVFLSWPKVYAHVLRVHQDVAIKCNVFRCLHFFRSDEERDKHYKEKHKEDKMKKIKCSQCDYRTNVKECFQKHFNLTHGTERLKCPKCPGKVYKSQMALRRHQNIIHSTKTVTCSLCGETYPRRRLSEHLKSESCPNCSAKLACFGLAKKHRLECKPSSKCEICGKVFQLLCRLKSHYYVCRKQMNTDKWKGLEFESRGFDCQKCKRYFSSKLSLASHCKNSHPAVEKKFDCDLCQKSSKSRAGIRIHMMTHHLGGEKEFYCSICDLNFSSKEKLRYHCNYFHGRSNYIECDKCGKILMEKQKMQHDQTFH